MRSGALRLFLELFTLASFLVVGLWTRRRWGRDGAWLYGFLAALGLVRENYVVIERLLYGYGDLALMAGAAPLIGAVIWGFSIVAAVAAAEAIRGAPYDPARPPGAGEAALVALFLVALAGFYEPFLARVEMARWEAGTAAIGGVPKIALVGYPSLALLSLLAAGAILGRLPGARGRILAMAGVVPVLAIGHAALLDRLKAALGW